MAAFDRDQLLVALNEIGAAAVVAGTRLDIAMFGGSALMLASNFRFSTEDVDIAEIGRPWPDWLSAVVARIASQNGWPDDWRQRRGEHLPEPACAQRKRLRVHGDVSARH